MNEQDVLGAFLLVNNPIVLSEEETKDVQKAIKKLQQENKQSKDNWNELKEYIKTIYKSCPPHEKEVLMFITDKIQELENGDGNEI